MAKLPFNDPCQWTKHDSFTSTPVIHRTGCWICEDPEFAQMGLPLCYLCKFCKGHVPADEIICSDCGKNQGTSDGN